MQYAFFQDKKLDQKKKNKTSVKNVSSDLAQQMGKAKGQQQYQKDVSHANTVQDVHSNLAKDNGKPIRQPTRKNSKATTVQNVRNNLAQEKRKAERTQNRHDAGEKSVQNVHSDLPPQGGRIAQRQQSRQDTRKASRKAKRRSLLQNRYTVVLY
jgi:hypothetical protein